jgi:hypothetical protein
MIFVEKLQILKSRISVGLDAPIRVLHITDTHIAYDDPIRYSGRYKCFETDETRGQTLDYLAQAIEYAKKENITIYGKKAEALQGKHFFSSVYHAVSCRRCIFSKNKPPEKS